MISYKGNQYRQLLSNSYNRIRYVHQYRTNQDWSSIDFSEHERMTTDLFKLWVDLGYPDRTAIPGRAYALTAKALVLLKQGQYRPSLRIRWQLMWYNLRHPKAYCELARNLELDGLPPTKFQKWLLKWVK